MSTSVDQAFITAYTAEVHEVFQRRGAFLKDSVFHKTNVVGSTASFHKIGKGAATTKARHGTITPMIHIHHARLNYTTPRQRDKAAAEQIAVDAIVTWLRGHCRGFDYSQSVIDMPAPDEVKHNDHLWVAMIGANLINRGLADVMATARIATDNKYAGLRHMVEIFDFLVSGTKGLGRTRIKRDTRDEIQWVPASWVTPIGSWTKAESLARVPHELLDLTRSCQRPDVKEGAIRNCGTCRTCRRLLQARKCIRDGMTIEAANEWLRLNAPAGITTLAPEDRFVWPVTLQDVERMEKAGEFYR
jgi:hypothetical protein